MQWEECDGGVYGDAFYVGVEMVVMIVEVVVVANLK